MKQPNQTGKKRFSFLNIARIIFGFSLVIAASMQLSAINIYGQEQIESVAGIDPTLVLNLSNEGFVERTIHQPDGKTILIGGFISDVNGTSRRNVVRLNADNSLDTSFNLAFNVSPLNMELLPDGKFIASSSSGLVRVNSDGSIDPSFNFSHTLHANRMKIRRRNDGKFLVSGNFEVRQGETIVARNLILVDESGNLVSGFQPEVNGFLIDVILLPDGKTIVYGGFEVKRAGQTIGRNFAILGENGVAEQNFDGFYGAPNGGESVKGVIFQPDGKLVLYGNFSRLQKAALAGKSSPNKGIVRLNPDGSFDRSFVTPYNSADIRSAVMQSDGKIVFDGNIDFPDGTSRRFLTRVLPDGAPDNSFANNLPFVTNFFQYLKQMEVMANGDILLNGIFKLSGRSDVPQLVRLNADGSPDATFQTPVILGGEIHEFKALPDGNLLIYGSFGKIGNRTRIGLARLSPNGLLDENFRFDVAHNENVRVKTVTAQPDGKLIISGQFSVVNGEYIQNPQTSQYYYQGTFNAVIRVHADGSLDSSFTPYTNAFDPVHCVALQPDGKILLSGQARVKPNMVVRLNADGTPDESFSWLPIGDGLFRDAAVYAIAVQPDGKIIIGGDFPSIRNSNQKKIARLNANGTLDYSFNYPYYPDSGGDIIEKIILQPDGKIIAGGLSLGSIFSSRPGLPRFNRSGTLDANFRWNQLQVQATTRDMKLLPDGKILFSGSIGGNGAPVYHPEGLARLNKNGEIEFQYNLKAEKFLLQADGKIILFNTVMQPGDFYVLSRIQPDGGTDDTFRFTFNMNVSNIILQPDGKIVVAGGFTKVNGGKQIGIVRLNP